MASFYERIESPTPDVCLYGLAPPKKNIDPAKLTALTEAQTGRIQALAPDALIVYDLQDESKRQPEFGSSVSLLADLAARDVRVREPRNPAAAEDCLPLRRTGHERELLELCHAACDERSAVAALVGIGRRTHEDLVPFRAVFDGGVRPGPRPGQRLLVRRCRHRGTSRPARRRAPAPLAEGRGGLPLLRDPSGLRRWCHEIALVGLCARSPAKRAETRSDHFHVLALRLAEDAGAREVARIAFPRWLENELYDARDILETSARLCLDTWKEVLAFAREKALPVGLNVESISVRKEEVEASAALFSALRSQFGTIP